MIDTPRLPCERALEVITGPLSAELKFQRVGSVARSKVHLFELGAPGGRQFGLVVGDMFATKNPKAPLQTRILFEKCNAPEIPGVVLCDDDYNGSRINQSDSRLAPPKQSSYLVADEAALISLLRWYATGSHMAVDGKAAGGIDALAQARLEKAAQDAGFDLSVSSEAGWFLLRSTAFSQVVGVSMQSKSDTEYQIGLSDTAIGKQICAEFGTETVAISGRWSMVIGLVPDYQTMHRVLVRTAAICRVVDGSGFRDFDEKRRKLPDTTEAVRLAVQRVGQDIFRSSLLDYWGRRCAVSGLNIPELLRASHIKPWADCASDAERLDVFNGLLLAPQLDALFDGGWITFSDSGQIVIADALDTTSRTRLGLTGAEVIQGLANGHRKHLVWHRQHCFRNGQ